MVACSVPPPGATCTPTFARGYGVGVIVGARVAVGTGVSVIVGVRVAVGTGGAVGGGVTVGVLVRVGVAEAGMQSRTLMVSMRQPALETLLSLPMRQRSWIFCPAAAAGRFTVVVIKPPELWPHACRPPS